MAKYKLAPFALWLAAIARRLGRSTFDGTWAVLLLCYALAAWTFATLIEGCCLVALVPALFLACVRWPARKPGRVFCWNFFTLILLGVAVSVWMYFWTDWFEYLVAFLGFGSVLSWLAFVAKLIPEARGKVIQKGLFGFFLGCPFAWVVYLGLLAVAVVVTGAFATVQLESAQTGADYQVAVYPDDGTRPSLDDQERLPAAGRMRFVRALPGWQPRTVKVAVSGFPDEEVRLRPWWDRKPLRVPYSFLRPVVLIAPSRLLIDQVANDWSESGYSYWMTVRIDKEDFSLAERYQGQPIWLGCSGDEGIELPAWLLDDWRPLLRKPPDQVPPLLAPPPLSKLVRPADQERLEKVLKASLARKHVLVRLQRKNKDGPLDDNTTEADVRGPRDRETLVQAIVVKPK